jgi:selT/selW/selH-like putative selenoprotein
LTLTDPNLCFDAPKFSQAAKNQNVSEVTFMPKLSVRIAYCQPCGHQPHAIQLANQLLDDYGMRFNREMEVVLVPVDRGEFDVFVNGEKVFSRYEAQRMPTFEEIKAAIEERLAKTK